MSIAWTMTYLIQSLLPDVMDFIIECDDVLVQQYRQRSNYRGYEFQPGGLAIYKISLRVDHLRMRMFYATSWPMNRESRITIDIAGSTKCT